MYDGNIFTEFLTYILFFMMLFATLKNCPLQNFNFDIVKIINIFLHASYEYLSFPPK